jgi:hypothetical protein
MTAYVGTFTENSVILSEVFVRDKRTKTQLKEPCT